MIDRFGRQSSFRDDEGRIRLPLHAPNEPALTEEYLLVNDRESPPVISFYDIGVGEHRSLPLPAFESTFPAWRVRFWTASFPIEDPPAFIQEFGTSPTETAAGTFDSVAPTPATPDPSTIVEEARSELTNRRSEERHRRRRAFDRLPLTEFIREYGGITDVVPGGRETDDFGQQSVVITIPSDHPKFDATDLERVTGISPGDVVVIDAAAHADLPVEAEVFAVENNRIEVGVYWDTADGSAAEAVFDADSEANICIGILVNGRRYAAIEAALGTVERTDHAFTRYAGRAELTFADESFDWDHDVELNRDQRTAVARALAAEGLALVRTPPGTGARRVLWSIIRATINDDGRVALFAPDQRSLDRLAHEAGDPALVDRAEEAGFAVHRCTTGAPSPVNADLIICPLSLATSVDDHDIDLAILDHAARVSVPAGAIPFAKAGRVLCVGDPMQSPPTPVDRAVKSSLAPSIFEHLEQSYDEGITVDLRCQYRMNQAIGLFPNREFYDGMLIHGQHNREQTIEATEPLVAYQIEGRERQTPTGSAFNEAAVETIRDEVDQLVKRGVDPSDIGIVTSSSAEVGKIRATLQEFDDDIATDVVVGGLDQFRCRHRSIVIVSFIRSGEASVETFWSNPGLNVAITRAERRLTMIGDWDAISEETDDVGSRLAEFVRERGLIQPPP